MTFLLNLLSNKVFLTILNITIATVIVLTTGNSKYLLNQILNIGKNFNVQLSAINDIPIIFIDDNAFKNKNIQKIIFPNELISIGKEAYKDNYISNVIFPNTVKTIETGAFFNNDLYDIELPVNIQVIESRVFMNNKLSTIEIPDNIITIKAEAFRSNNISEIVIPENVKSIAFRAFDDNPIQRIKIGHGVLIDINSFPHNFQSTYEKNQRKGGEYIYQDEIWYYRYADIRGLVK